MPLAQPPIPTIDRNGGRMPVIGLGTWQLRGATCRDAVAMALDCGYRHIDTAQMYENEAEVGDGIRASAVRRDEIFLTTKVFTGHLHADGVRKACDRSLERLKTDYVDLYLIHWPDASVPLEETLGMMNALREAGKVRHVGVSNFTIEWLRKALAATPNPIFCNQIEYHPYLSCAPVLDFGRQHGISAVAYSPLARGRAATDARLKAIGAKHGKSAAQVALRWLLHQDGVAVIPKGSSERHIRANLDVFDFALTQDEQAAIARLEKNQRMIDPDWAPDWDA